MKKSSRLVVVSLFSFLLTFTFSQTAKSEGGIVPRPVAPPAVKPPTPPVPVVPPPKVPTPTPAKPPTVIPPTSGGSITPGSAPSAGMPATVDPAAAKRLGTTPSHRPGTAIGPGAGKRAAKNSLSAEEVMARIQSDALKKAIKDSPEAQEGIAVRENLLDTALNGQKALTHQSAGKFEKALMERLVGKDLSKMTEKDLKDLQSLTCGPMCGGHENMALTCRRVSKLLAALQSTPGILATSGALGTLFAAYVNTEVEKKNGSESMKVAGDGVFVELKDLDKPIPQEKLVPEAAASTQE
jgi:hypothetical protein